MRLVEDVPPEQVGVALTEDSVLCPSCQGARLVHPVDSGAVMGTIPDCTTLVLLLQPPPPSGSSPGSD